MKAHMGVPWDKRRGTFTLPPELFNNASFLIEEEDDMAFPAPYGKITRVFA